MNPEQQLQAKIIMSFSQQRPEERGQLWSTQNRSLSLRDGQTQKATGLFAGVSDLLYFKNKKLIAIEIKAPGSRHDKQHIQNQFEWGQTIVNNGGEWYIIRTLDAFWCALTNKEHKDILTLTDVEIMLKTNNKTICF